MFQTVSDAVPTTCVNLVRLRFVALASQHLTDDVRDVTIQQDGAAATSFALSLPRRDRRRPSVLNVPLISSLALSAMDTR